MTQVIIGKQVETGDEFTAEVELLIEGGLLLTASSGNGKSRKIKKIMQKTYGKCGQIVIDPEGDFNNMRTENYDYIIAGKDEGADIKITHKGEFPAMLARKVLELNANIIIDLYELEPHEQKEFTAKFVRALVDIPKTLWGKKYLVIIDEAHELCPQELRKGESTASRDAIIALAAKGRKRGLRLVAATQRLSKLAKNATSELKNQLVGGLNNSDDRKRACEELGMDKAQADIFRTLDVGNFFAVGPAFGFKDARLVRAGPLDDNVSDKATARDSRYIQPPTEKVKAVLGKLADLPQEAERELKTKQELEAEVARLRIEVKRKELSGSKQPVRTSVVNQPSQEQIKQIHDEGYRKGWGDCWREWNGFVAAVPKDLAKITAKIDQLSDIRNTLANLHKSFLEKLPATAPNLPKPVIKPLVITTEAPKKVQERLPSAYNNPAISSGAGIDGLKDGAVRMLKAAAMYHPSSISKNQMGTIAGFSVQGGTFQTYFGELRRRNLIEVSGEEATATDEGMALVGDVNPLPTDPESILNMWKPKFKAGAAKMLEVVFRAYPNEITKDELGAETGFTPTGGTFQTYMGELRRNGLIEVSGDSIKASKELFPQ